MDTEKIKTLEQIIDSMEIVENARSTSGLSKDERLELEKASVQLRNLERTIIRIRTTEVVDKLTADTKALEKLTKEIEQTSEKLTGVVKSMEKVVTTIEAFINIAAQAIAFGLTQKLL